jgi:hypothetical protein
MSLNHKSSTESRNMLKKILLGCSLTGLTIGLGNIGLAPGWGIGLPLGAVFLALFFIVTVLEKEFALYDAEQAAHPSKAKHPVGRKSVVAGGVLKTA